MTVIAIDQPRIQYVYEENKQNYTITFPYKEREYIKCLINEQELEYGIHYSVPVFDAESLERNELEIELLITPDENLDDGPIITVGDTITIYRATTIDQQAEFPQNAKFSSQKITEVVDKITMILQEIDDTVACCLKLPRDIALNFNTVIPAPAPYMVLRWNSEGTSIENVDLPGIRKIEKTKTEGLVDTYTVYYTNDTTWEYQVTNGEKGDKGNQGDPGEKGDPGEPGPHVVDIELVEKVGYDALYKMIFSDESEFEYTVTDGVDSTLTWKPVSDIDWHYNNGLYEYQLTGSFSVQGVYRGDWTARHLVQNINVKVEGIKTTLYSKDAFVGYLLLARTTDEESGKLFTFIQDDESDVWYIEHNLETYPSVTAVDTSGSVIEGAVTYVDEYTVQIDFSIPVRGVAYLNYTI